MAQKVIIPKGLVNPNETTIVEIPSELQHIDTVVAKAIPKSPYQKFSPRYTSSPGNSPAQSPASVRKYYSGLEHSITPASYYDVTPTAEGDMSTEMSSSYNPSMTPDDSCPCPESSASTGDYQRFDSSDSGAYQRFDSIDSGDSPCPPCPPGTEMSKQTDIMATLSQLESEELKKIMCDLEKFQKARRSLVRDASNLTTAADLSDMILNSFQS